jgi:hypothetical protein
MKHNHPRAVHTTDIHKVERMWLLLGGQIESVRRTGETRYRHDNLDRPLRVNSRRNDVPAKLLTVLNRVTKLQAANDSLYQSNPDKPTP